MWDLNPHCNTRKRLKGISTEGDQNKRQEGKSSPHSGIKKVRRGIARQDLPPEEGDEDQVKEAMKNTLECGDIQRIDMTKVMF